MTIIKFIFVNSLLPLTQSPKSATRRKYLSVRLISRDIHARWGTIFIHSSLSQPKERW